MRMARYDKEEKLTECLSTDLPAFVADLVPCSIVHLVGTIADLTRETYNLSNHHLSYTSGVCEWRVENSNAVLGGIFEVDLVRSDTETSNNNEILGFLQDFCGKFRL